MGYRMGGETTAGAKPEMMAQLPDKGAGNIAREGAPVEACLDALERALNRLDNEVEHLGDRIGAAVRPSEPPPVATATLQEETLPGESPLALALKALVRQAERTTRQVWCLSERQEL